MDILQWLLSGGGIVALLTIPYAVKKARSEAEGEIEQRWKALNDETKERYNELAQRVERLEQKVGTRERIIMRAYTCRKWEDGKTDCPVLKEYTQTEENERDK